MILSSILSSKYLQQHDTITAEKIARMPKRIGISNFLATGRKKKKQDEKRKFTFESHALRQ